jgi:hypothetical protein
MFRLQALSLGGEVSRALLSTSHSKLKYGNSFSRAMERSRRSVLAFYDRFARRRQRELARRTRYML